MQFIPVIPQEEAATMKKARAKRAPRWWIEYQKALADKFIKLYVAHKVATAKRSQGRAKVYPKIQPLPPLRPRSARSVSQSPKGRC